MKNETDNTDHSAVVRAENNTGNANRNATINATANPTKTKDRLNLRTFGGLSVRFHGTEIISGSQGGTQAGLFLLLLMHFGIEGVARSLIKTTLFEDRDIKDISHTIRNVMYNTRKQLRARGLPDVPYFKQKGGVYYWLDDIDVLEDAKEFEEAYEAALEEEDPEKRCELMTDNCYRYAGRFLAGMDNVAWIYREQERYLDIFNACMEDALTYMRQAHTFKDMYELGLYAVTVDPFHEWEVVVMEALTGLGRFAKAESYYTVTLDKYIKEYGNLHNEYVRDIVHKLGELLFFQTETIDVIQDKLRDSEESGRGGYYCPRPVFQELYRTVDRTMHRVGEMIYLMLCTIVDSKGNPMREGPKLDELSERLHHAVIESVRTTDTVTKYGKGQYLVLLINTTEENCSIVEKRINQKFKIKRQRTGLEFSVSALTAKYEDQ